MAHHCWMDLGTTSQAPANLRPFPWRSKHYILPSTLGPLNPLFHTHACSQSLSPVWLFVTPWTVARQAPLFMEFFRQQHWSGLPFSPPGTVPTQGSNAHLLGRWILYHLATRESPLSHTHTHIQISISNNHLVANTWIILPPEQALPFQGHQPSL